MTRLLFVVFFRSELDGLARGCCRLLAVPDCISLVSAKNIRRLLKVINGVLNVVDGLFYKEDSGFDR